MTGVTGGVDTALALSEIGDSSKYCYSPPVLILSGCSKLCSVSFAQCILCMAVHTLYSEITYGAESFLEKPVVAQLVNKFLAFCATRRIPLLILVLWQVNLIHSLFVKKDPFNVSCGRYLGHRSGVCPTCFLTITTHFSSPPCVPHAHPI